MGALTRPMLPAGSDGRHIPERDERLAQPGSLEFTEDQTRRWVSISIVGGLLLLVNLRLALVFSSISGPESLLSWVVVLTGLSILLFGAFIAYATYAAAIGWVGLAGTIVFLEGVALATWAGAEGTWIMVLAILVVGLALLAVGVWRSLVSWIQDRRDDEVPSPS